MTNSNLHNFVCNHRSYFKKHGFNQSDQEEWLCLKKSVEAIQEELKNCGSLLLAEIELDNLEKWAEESIKDYGEILCEWHQRLAMARHDRTRGADDLFCRKWSWMYGKQEHIEPGIYYYDNPHVRLKTSSIKKTL